MFVRNLISVFHIGTFKCYITQDEVGGGGVTAQRYECVQFNIRYVKSECGVSNLQGKSVIQCLDGFIRTSKDR